MASTFVIITRQFFAFIGNAFYRDNRSSFLFLPLPSKPIILHSTYSTNFSTSISLGYDFALCSILRNLLRQFLCSKVCSYSCRSEKSFQGGQISVNCIPSSLIRLSSSGYVISVSSGCSCLLDITFLEVGRILLSSAFF